jgi:hypothetical protein
MNVVLAAIDDSAAAGPVLAAAKRIAPFVGADVVAVHVREDGSGSTARAVADAAEVPLLVRDGANVDVVAELRTARHELHALAVVAGARRVPAGARPAGHVVLRLLEELTASVLVVPPDAVDRPIGRVLVCVEGDGENDALVALVEQLGEEPGPEVVALHVLPPDALPRFGDEPVLETEAWTEEFLRRAASAPADRVRLEVRVGSVADVVPSSLRELDPDLVVMAWHCALGEGRAKIVRRVLEESSVPLLLLPAGEQGLLSRTASPRPTERSG